MLTQISTRADGLRRLAGEAGVEAGDERAGEVDAGRQGEDARAVLGGKSVIRRELRLGERDALGPADVGPAAGVDDAAEPALGDEASQTGLSEKTSVGESRRARRGR